MNDYQRTAKTGALAVVALVLFIPVVIGLHSLGVVDESHCRSTETGVMFHTLHDTVGDMMLKAGTGDEVGRCILPRFRALDGWRLPGGDLLDLGAATPSLLDPDDLTLPVDYQWVGGGYAIAAAGPVGRLLPPLVPLLGLLVFLSAFAVSWRQWHDSD